MLNLKNHEFKVVSYRCEYMNIFLIAPNKYAEHEYKNFQSNFW